MSLLQEAKDTDLSSGALASTLERATIVKIEDNAVRHFLPFLVRCKGGLELAEMVAFRDTF